MSDNTTTNVESTTENTAVATPVKRVLVHTRNDEDKSVLSRNFDLSKLGKVSYVTGLTTEARMSLVKAAAAGIQIVSTGLPLDLTAELGGKVTIVRAWEKTKEDGSKSSGSIPPADYFAGKVMNPEAFARLQENPDFVAAFTKAEEEEGEEGADVPF